MFFFARASDDPLESEMEDNRYDLMGKNFEAHELAPFKQHQPGWKHAKPSIYFSLHPHLKPQAQIITHNSGARSDVSSILSKSTLEGPLTADTAVFSE